MYKVICPFTDLHDNDYPYAAGDTFPRAGISVTEKRLKELAGSSNKQKKPLIEEVKDAAAEAAHEAAEEAVKKTARKRKTKSEEVE
jgi:hypothetical protein